MITVTIRLKDARKKAGMTQAEVSESSGIPLGTIRRWEQGVNEPDVESIIQLAKLYGTSTDFLLGSRFSIPPEVVSPDAAFVDVPLYGSIAAGMPIEMDAADDMHPIPSSVHRMWPDAFLLRVEGRSMDRILPDGCYALVDPRRDVAHDGMPHAVCVNGYDATIKRVRRLANGFELAPDSSDPTYKPKIYDYGEEGTEEITIIGEVVWYCVPDDWSF